MEAKNETKKKMKQSEKKIPKWKEKYGWETKWKKNLGSKKKPKKLFIYLFLLKHAKRKQNKSHFALFRFEAKKISGETGVP